jgi:pimeloyl-ACP methyl ester carboxylesterase
MKHIETPERKLRGRIRLARTVFIPLAILVLWGIVGFLATIPVVGNHPYWRTLRAQPKDFALDAEDVSLPSTDGIRLTAWYIPARPIARGTVILAHGINGNRSDMLPRAAFLVKAGYNTLLLDLRGHGGSDGDYAGPGYMESLDVLGGVSYLKKRGEQAPIITMGHSYGAVASLYAAAQSQEVAAVIADSAFISFEDMVKRATILLADDPERSVWERLGLRLAGFHATELAVLPILYIRTGVWYSGRKSDSLRAIPLIGKRPILFIGGQRHEICPPENARVMYDTALSPDKQLLIVPDADHDSTFKTAPQLYEAAVLRFLTKIS